MTYATSTSLKSAAAKEQLESRFRLGVKEQNRLVEQVASTVIRDRLVPPSRMFFRTHTKPQMWHLGTNTTDHEVDGFDIHPHALSQLCSVARISKTYVTRLLEHSSPWEKGLFDSNMNTLFSQGKYIDRAGNPTKFLHRMVGNELRGFLSRNFNRQLASLPLLRGFMSACTGAGAQPVESGTSAVRFSLKCYLPHVFEPVEGEFIAVGVLWSNSDFGAGRLKVALSTMRISNGGVAVLSDVMSRVHIGSIIQDSDLELSDDAAKKEVDAQIAVIHDAVMGQLGAGPVNRFMEVIAAAHEEEIPWHRLKVELGRLLQKTELADVKKLLDTGADDIVDLPPPGRTGGGDAIATRWWASNVVSWMASKEQSADRQNDLQQLAGDILGKNIASVAVTAE